MDDEFPSAAEVPPCEQVADTGGMNLLPLPRLFAAKGQPFKVTTLGRLFVSPRVTPGACKRFLALAERLSAFGIRIQTDSAPQLAAHQAFFTDTAQFPKSMHLEPNLRGEAARPGGYKISVGPAGILMHGADELGVQHACATVYQLVEDGPEIPGMEIEDYPLLPSRAIHFDFKGWPPTAAWLKKAIDALADVKINILILEYEAHFAFPSQPAIVAEGALSPQEIQELDHYAREKGVVLVPLINCVANAGHVLSHADYEHLREQTDSTRTYCIANPKTLDFLIHQIADVLPAHGGKIFHIGGDGAIVLGSNPTTLERAEELGGLDAVYLDHIGAVCRFLHSNGFQALISDEMLRGMSDEQIRWLPADATFVFWLPDGLSPELAHGILAHLDRYKTLGRRTWGAATISRKESFEAFDHIDAWAGIGDMKYISGFVATLRTREFAHSAMLPPPEVFWPQIYYAADRAWAGKQASPRELFPQRFERRFFGLQTLDTQSRMWAGAVNLITENPVAAHAFFRAEMPYVRKNPDSAHFLLCWSAIQAFLHIFLEIESEVRGNFVHIQNGTAEAALTGKLRWRVLEMKARAPALIAQMTQAAENISTDLAVHEFIESSVAYTLRRLDEIEPLLAAYPLPSERAREALGI